MSEPGLERGSPCDREGISPAYRPRKLPRNPHDMPTSTLVTASRGSSGWPGRPEVQEEDGPSLCGGRRATSRDPHSCAQGVETRPLTGQQATRRSPHLCLKGGQCATHTSHRKQVHEAPRSTCAVCPAVPQRRGHADSRRGGPPARLTLHPVAVHSRAQQGTDLVPVSLQTLAEDPLGAGHQAHDRDKLQFLPARGSRSAQGAWPAGEGDHTAPGGCALKMPQRRPCQG